LNINSGEIINLFLLIAPEIFDYIGKSKDEVVKKFIKGFVDAEGHIDKKRAMITVCQKKGQILRYLQLFLLRLGIRSTIKFEIGRKKMSVLRILCRDVLKYLQIGFSAMDKQKRLIECISEIRNTYEKEMMPIKREDVWSILEEAGLFPSTVMKSRPGDYKWINRNELAKAFHALMGMKIQDRQIKQKMDFIFALLNSDIIFEKIREINVWENKEKELFYDFSVPETQNYSANGFIVHNSTFRLYLRRSKKTSRVAKLIDSPNLPDNECIFYVGAKGVNDEESA
jgi:intein/homing endonuclease